MFRLVHPTSFLVSAIFISTNLNTIENYDKFPDPGQYKLPSDFEKSKNTYNQGGLFSFGSGRDAYDRVYYKERIPLDQSIPGPGHYD